MNVSRPAFLAIAERLMRCPAAAYHESLVMREAEHICAEHDLPHKRDGHGNLLIRWQYASGLRPLVLAAHLDHPGFVIERRITSRRWAARFRGGVSEKFFRPGLGLRLMPENAPAKLGRKLSGVQRFEILADRPIRPAPPFAVWELDDFALHRGRIHGRACDDLIGAAAILAMLVELKRAKIRANVIGVLARAEEVGFHGALLLADAKRLPKNSLVISLETSRELPGVKMGNGVIIRVGDRASVFDPAATRFLGEVAAGLKARRRKFAFQRALMSGGTCEATAYQEFGYQTAALCVALGNYHNCGANTTIAAEFVSVADACGMVELLVETARQMPKYRSVVDRLPERLRSLLREARLEMRRGN